RRIAFRGDVDPNEKPEPIAAEADHQRADVPERRERGWRCGGWRRIAEHHDRRGDDVDHEAIHAEQVREATPRIAELARQHDVDDCGLHGDRDHLPTADVLLALLPGLTPI